MDECTAGTYNCPNTARCENIQGGYECVCKDGFTGDGTVCTGKCAVVSLFADVAPSN